MMNIVAQILRKFALLFGRDRFRRELDEEMAFHREEAEREWIDAGVLPRAAHTAALRQFGNPTLLRERSQGAIAFRAEVVLHDLRFALRQLRRNPGFAITAILILALGIGASVAIFAFVDAALIKPLPYPAPNRLVAVNESSALFPRNNISYLDFLDWQRLNTVFSSFAVYNAHRFEFNTPSGTQSVHGLSVSAAFFATLGVHPMLGRDFRPSDHVAGATPVVILRYGAWQRRFGGRRDVIGESVNLSGVAYTIVGVLPPDFEFAPRDVAEFFDPMLPTGECHLRRSCHDLDGIARLKHGVTVASAEAQMESIAQRLEKQYPDSNRGQGASIIPLSQAIVGDIKPILLVLLGGAGLLLLIACVNVSSLMLVRSESRRHEFAVRTALGASYSRVSRQMVTEALLLAGLGGGLGLGLAYAGMHGLKALISADWMAGMPFLRGLGLNVHVLVFAAVLALLAAALFSISPILHFRLSNIRAGLMETARSSAGRVWQRMGTNLVVIELATAVVLLSGAGLLAKSLYKLLHEDLGFTADHLATANVGLPQAVFSTDTKEIAFEHALLQRAAAIPGVQSVALTSVLPVSCNCNTDWVRFVGRPYNGIHNEVNEREVSTGFFQTIGVRLKSGRLFDDGDTAGKPKVIIINQAFADKYFPGQDPLGAKLGNTELSPDSIREIVGVVENFKDASLDEDQWPAEYEPFDQSPDGYFNLILRTRQDADALLPALPSMIQRVNPAVSVDWLRTMKELIDDSHPAYIHRSAAYLVGCFALLALVLGTIGLYGVIAYSVSQRTREIGVRMALGAQRAAVYKMVLGQAGWLSGIGIAVGLACSVGAALLMRKLLFGVAAWDVPTLSVVALVLALAALAASFLPARRAASINPTDALRVE